MATKRYELSFLDEQEEKKFELNKDNIKRIIRCFKEYSSFILPNEDSGIQYYHPTQITINTEIVLDFWIKKIRINIIKTYSKKENT